MQSVGHKKLLGRLRCQYNIKVGLESIMLESVHRFIWLRIVNSGVLLET
jgi:hypothetical protein